MTPNFRRRYKRHCLRDEDGQAALETLLIFPLFIVIVLMAVDFGVWMYQSVSVANAVREGARYAALKCPGAGTCDATEIADYTALKSSGSLESTDVHVTWAPSGSIAAGSKGSSVAVEACRDYTLLFIPITLTNGLISAANMRVETTVTVGTNSTC